MPFALSSLRANFSFRVTAAFRPRAARRTATWRRTPTTMAAPGSRVELHSLPGVAKSRDPATKDYVMQQCMLRVRDPKDSLAFYTGVLGMTLLCKLEFADMKFSLYFMGYADPAEVPEDPVERARGTESDPDFPGYCSGNEEGKRGFGHIGISVPDVAAACKRFEELGVEFVKRPQDGKMKNIAFIKDPDGYWIEILGEENSEMLVNWPGNAEAKSQ